MTPAEARHEIAAALLIPDRPRPDPILSLEEIERLRFEIFLARCFWPTPLEPGEK